MKIKSCILKGGLSLVFLLFLGCSKESIEEVQTNTNLDAALSIKFRGTSNTFYGPQVKLGQGHVRTWIRISKDGVPEEIGIATSKNLLDHLPSGDDPVQLVLPFHQKARELTPFDHVFFDWNPHGHEPEGVFTVPHFDVHFYMTSVADREAIPIYPDAMAQFDNYPPAGYLPSDYFTPPAGGTAAPQMGTHWLPVSFVPPFTNILIYGSYDGEVTFIEPMNTVDYLRNGALPFSEAYSQPTKFAKTSYYPTVYNVYSDTKSNQYYISLSNFVHRDAE
ncbi:MAG: DUF5602 domain-containing protein [Maribacter sp.]|nr:DUF5602 domain-containing protein [Maribacter sp.]